MGDLGAHATVLQLSRVLVFVALSPPTLPPNCSGAAIGEQQFQRWAGDLEGSSAPNHSVARRNCADANRGGTTEYEVRSARAADILGGDNWDVFFIQDGDIPAMVDCTDAASSILCHQPLANGSVFAV